MDIPLFHILILLMFILIGIRGIIQDGDTGIGEMRTLHLINPYLEMYVRLLFLLLPLEKENQHLTLLLH